MLGQIVWTCMQKELYNEKSGPQTLNVNVAHLFL